MGTAWGIANTTKKKFGKNEMSFSPCMIKQREKCRGMSGPPPSPITVAEGAMDDLHSQSRRPGVFVMLVLIRNWVKHFVHEAFPLLSSFLWSPPTGCYTRINIYS